MLAGALALDDYLRPFDVEYPAFSRKMCYLLSELQANGKKIFQIEPFLEILLGIHEFFAEGHRPGELKKNSVQYPVYLAERNATKALVEYYQIAVACQLVDQYVAGSATTSKSGGMRKIHKSDRTTRCW